MSNAQTINIIGNLAADVEVSQDKQGKVLVVFPLAVDRADGSAVDFHRVRIEHTKRRKTNIENHVSKGDLVQVCGHLENHSYNDSNGDLRYMTVIIPHHIKALGKKAVTIFQ